MDDGAAVRIAPAHIRARSALGYPGYHQRRELAARVCAEDVNASDTAPAPEQIECDPVAESHHRDGLRPSPSARPGYADCLSALMDALELDPAHVLGLSWGGGLAQELYARHPGNCQTLILADTYAGWRGSLAEDVCAERLDSCLRESELDAGQFIPDWMPGS